MGYIRVAKYSHSSSWVMIRTKPSIFTHMNSTWVLKSLMQCTPYTQVNRGWIHIVGPESPQQPNKYRNTSYTINPPEFTPITNQVRASIKPLPNQAKSTSFRIWSKFGSASKQHGRHHGHVREIKDTRSSETRDSRSSETTKTK